MTLEREYDFEKFAENAAQCANPFDVVTNLACPICGAKDSLDMFMPPQEHYDYSADGATFTETDTIRCMNCGEFEFKLRAKYKLVSIEVTE